MEKNIIEPIKFLQKYNKFKNDSVLNLYEDEIIELLEEYKKIIIEENNI